MNGRVGVVIWCVAAAACGLFAWGRIPGSMFAAVLGLAAGTALATGGTAARLMRLLGVETTKLVRNRVFLFGLVATVAITLLAGWIHEPLDGETGWSIAASSVGTGFWCAEVFLLVLGATSIAGELGQGTLKMILPHAFRRSEWIAAKALSLVLAAVVFAAAATLVGSAYTGAVYGLGDVVKELPAGFGEEQGTVEIFQSAEVMRGHLLDVATAGLASLVATALIGLFFSTLFDSVVPALSASFLLFLGLESADVLLGLPRDVLLKIYASYPDQLQEWTVKLGRGLNETWDPQVLGVGIGLAALTGATAWLLAIARFDRRDLHG